MAKKRVKKSSKKTKRTSSAKRSNVRSSRTKSPKRRVTDRKVKLVIKNIIFSFIIFAISLGLYNVSSNEIYSNLFWMIAMISGFVFVAFVIVYLVFLFMKMFRR